MQNGRASHASGLLMDGWSVVCALKKLEEIILFLSRRKSCRCPLDRWHERHRCRKYRYEPPGGQSALLTCCRCLLRGLCFTCSGRATIQSHVYRPPTRMCRSLPSHLCVGICFDREKLRILKWSARPWHSNCLPCSTTIGQFGDLSTRFFGKLTFRLISLSYEPISRLTHDQRCQFDEMFWIGI